MGSVAVETKLKRVFGWWDWDAETPALVNRVTGERLAFCGKFQDTELVPSDEHWLRFDYLHPELSFPLLVRERLVDLSRHGIKTAWTADYEKSVALWRRESRARTIAPPYGAWRRIDDCATDALACWPETACVREPLRGNVVFRGGWLNGEWAVEWQRQYDRLPQQRSIQPTPVEPDSWLQPLNESPPSRWTYHPFVPQGQTGTTATLEAEVFLRGLLIEGKGSQRRLVLPADVPLNTLEGRTAYLLTEDGGRLLYPMAGETDPMRSIGHSSPQFRLLYADKDVVCELFGRPLGKGVGSVEWKFSSAPVSLASRSPGAAAVVGGTGWVDSAPLPRRLWLRIQWTLFDAWSQWRGTDARSPQWLDALHLQGANAVAVSAGYRGGQLIGHLNSVLGKFTLQTGRR